MELALAYLLQTASSSPSAPASAPANPPPAPPSGPPSAPPTDHRSEHPSSTPSSAAISATDGVLSPEHQEGVLSPLCPLITPHPHPAKQVEVIFQGVGVAGVRYVGLLQTCRDALPQSVCSNTPGPPGRAGQVASALDAAATPNAPPLTHTPPRVTHSIPHPTPEEEQQQQQPQGDGNQGDVDMDAHREVRVLFVRAVCARAWQMHPCSTLAAFAYVQARHAYAHLHA
eukprot:scaffold149390_cov27-Tisochrysis_lutea.AAC.1